MAKKKVFFNFKKVNYRRLSIGVALLFLGTIVMIRGINSYNAQTAKASGAVDAAAFEDKSGDPSNAQEPTRVIIPKVSIDLTVKKAKIIAGYWQVFNDTAAWGEQSGYPGQQGNQVIFAHARKGLFLPLRNVTVGDKVYVMTVSNWYSYEVKETKEVMPSQLEVIAPTTDETLTLYTCSGFEDSKRMIVIAKRI